jgi:hypothetical protein
MDDRLLMDASPSAWGSLRVALLAQPLRVAARAAVKNK